MTKDKQILKMARDITYIDVEGEHEGTCCRLNCNQADTMACALIAKGYRRADEVAEKILGEVEAIIRKYDERPKYQLILDLAELKKKYTESEGEG